MIGGRRLTGLRRLCSFSVGVVLLAGAAAACEPVTAGQGGSRGSPAESATLGSCPQLSRDEAGQAACVRAMQEALRASGYPDQPVTGVFGAVTEQNLRDFQRRHGISPVSGVFGPKTRAALAGGGPSSDPAVPATTPASYSRHSYCGDRVCDFFLRRGNTSRYARQISEHPRIAAVVTGAVLLGVCRLLVLRVAKGVCGLLAGSYADDIGDDLVAAARQHACLRVRVGLQASSGGTWKLIDSNPDNSWRCSD